MHAFALTQASCDVNARTSAARRGTTCPSPREMHPAAARRAAVGVARSRATLHLGQWMRQPATPNRPAEPPKAPAAPVTCFEKMLFGANNVTCARALTPFTIGKSIGMWKVGEPPAREARMMGAGDYVARRSAAPAIDQPIDRQARDSRERLLPRQRRAVRY